MSHNDAPGYPSILLAFSPFENKEILEADEHFSLASFALSVFGTSFWHVVSMTGDNFSTNFTFSKKMQFWLCGCARYRSNLESK